MSKQKLLAIDTSSRELGIVVLDKTEILYFGIKSLKKYRPINKLSDSVKNILNWVVKAYNIRFFVMETSSKSQLKSPLFNTVIESIKETTQENNLKIHCYEPLFVHQSICREKKPTRINTAQILVEIYPELERYFKLQCKSKTKYWMHAFDALAVGLVHINKRKQAKNLHLKEHSLLDCRFNT